MPKLPINQLLMLFLLFNSSDYKLLSNISWGGVSKHLFIPDRPTEDAQKKYFYLQVRLGHPTNVLELLAEAGVTQAAASVQSPPQTGLMTQASSVHGAACRACRLAGGWAGQRASSPQQLITASIVQGGAMSTVVLLVVMRLSRYRYSNVSNHR